MAKSRSPRMIAVDKSEAADEIYFEHLLTTASDTTKNKDGSGSVGSGAAPLCKPEGQSKPPIATGVIPLLVPVWPKLDDAALIGMIGELVKKAAENSEADPSGILFNLLPLLGCIVGPETFIEIGDDKHPARLFTLTVGATGSGRKGTAAAPVKKLAENFPAGLAVRITPGPLSSGEGLIKHVRDASEKLKDNGNPVDPGVADKRLFVLSPEFASALAAMKREGNTVATTVRCFFDDGNADPLTKTEPIKATGAHICIATHITKEELLKRLEDTEIYSGTMNRF